MSDAGGTREQIVMWKAFIIGREESKDSCSEIIQWKCAFLLQTRALFFPPKSNRIQPENTTEYSCYPCISSISAKTVEHALRIVSPCYVGSRGLHCSSQSHSKRCRGAFGARSDSAPKQTLMRRGRGSLVAMAGIRSMIRAALSGMDPWILPFPDFVLALCRNYIARVGANNAYMPCMPLIPARLGRKSISDSLLSLGNSWHAYWRIEIWHLKNLINYHFKKVEKGYRFWHTCASISWNNWNADLGMQPDVRCLLILWRGEKKKRPHLKLHFNSFKWRKLD